MMPSRVDSKVWVEGLPSVTSTSGFDQFDLPLDERQADLRLLRRRRPVAGRPPRNDVGDVGVAAIKPDRRDHPVEQFARAPDKRQALDVFLASGSLADEHDAGLRVAVGEYQPGCGEFQRAAVEIFQHRAQRFERRGGPRRFPRRQDGGLRARRRLPSRGRDSGGSDVLTGFGRRRFAGAGMSRGPGTISGSDSRLTGSSNQRTVDPGLQIEGQQLLNSGRAVRRHGWKFRGIPAI